MPGPGSNPVARDDNGHIVKGKSALRRAGLTSRTGIKPDDHAAKTAAAIHAAARRAAETATHSEAPEAR